MSKDKLKPEWWQKDDQYGSLELHPLNELINSEEKYVYKLRFVYTNYISLVDISQKSSKMKDKSLFVGEPPPNPPNALVMKWRIIWANWLQLLEWHDIFLRKIKNFTEKRDYNMIPEIFIASNSKLRSIYSKYCENYRKAVMIVNAHKAYFETLRIYFNDRDDIISHLMQPIQRIMRYHLPLTECIKIMQEVSDHETESEKLNLWLEAERVCREIPHDSQLILEATRIEGFPNPITTLGNIRLYNIIYVAIINHRTLKRAIEMIQTIENKRKSVEITSEEALAMAYGEGSALNELKFHERRVFLFDQALLITEADEKVAPYSSSVFLGREPASISRFQSLKNIINSNTPGTCLSQKPGDPFSQSTYNFLHSVNVNKMKFMANWRQTGSSASSIVSESLKYASGLPSAGSSSKHSQLTMGTQKRESRINPETNRDIISIIQRFQEIYKVQDEAASNQTNDGFFDALWFAVSDESPGKDCVYIFDPMLKKLRNEWIKSLEQIQNMQASLLVALTDPKKFSSFSKPSSKKQSVSSINECILSSQGLQIQTKEDASETGEKMKRNSINSFIELSAPLAQTEDDLDISFDVKKTNSCSFEDKSTPIISCPQFATDDPQTDCQTKRRIWSTKSFRLITKSERKKVFQTKISRSDEFSRNPHSVNPVQASSSLRKPSKELTGTPSFHLSASGKSSGKISLQYLRSFKMKSLSCRPLRSTNSSLENSPQGESSAQKNNANSQTNSSKINSIPYA